MFGMYVFADAYFGSEIEAWLESFDVDAHGGRGFASFTKEPEKAMRFDSAADVLEAWKTRSTVDPTRDDGQPNRPLTAYTMSPLRLP